MPAKKASTATSSPVVWTSMWRSRNSGSKRSRLNLFFRELALANRLLQLEQSLVAGLEAVADPHAPTHVDTVEV